MTEESQGESWKQGTVSRYDLDRGFGVIRGDDGEDYYMHFREIKGAWEPEQNMSVRFLAEWNRKGNIAKKVSPQ